VPTRRWVKYIRCLFALIAVGLTIGAAAVGSPPMFGIGSRTILFDLIIIIAGCQMLLTIGYGNDRVGPVMFCFASATLGGGLLMLTGSLTVTLLAIMVLHLAALGVAQLFPYEKPDQQTAGPGQ